MSEQVPPNIHDEQRTETTASLAFDELDQAQSTLNRGWELLRVLQSFPDGTAPELLAQIFHELSVSAEASARAICIRAIEQKTLTRRRTGEILGLHENTVARWITAREARRED